VNISCGYVSHENHEFLKNYKDRGQEVILSPNINRIPPLQNTNNQAFPVEEKRGMTDVGHRRPLFYKVGVIVKDYSGLYR